MSSSIETLECRAIACKHWRWMPGMVTETGIRVLRRDTDGYTIGYGPRTSYCIMEVTSDALPDFSDPATLGCLAALVREATGKPWLFAQFTLQDTWSICDLHDHRSHFVGSEAEAWIEVLEEVP